jgi:hypothetical protein
VNGIRASIFDLWINSEVLRMDKSLTRVAAAVLDVVVNYRCYIVKVSSYIDS